jgi:hypothetical protein
MVSSYWESSVSCKLGVVIDQIGLNQKSPVSFSTDFKAKFHQNPHKWFQSWNIQIHCYAIMQTDVLTINSWVEELSTQAINRGDMLWTHITVVHWMAGRWMPVWDISICLCLDLSQQAEPQGSGLHVTTNIWFQQPAMKQCPMSTILKNSSQYLEQALWNSIDTKTQGWNFKQKTTKA